MSGRCPRRGYEGETDGWRAFVAVQPINQEPHLLGADAAVRKYAFLLRLCGERVERGDPHSSLPNQHTRHVTCAVKKTCMCTQQDMSYHLLP